MLAFVQNAYEKTTAAAAAAAATATGAGARTVTPPSYNEWLAHACRHVGEHDSLPEALRGSAFGDVCVRDWLIDYFRSS